MSLCLFNSFVNSSRCGPLTPIADSSRFSSAVASRSWMRIIYQLAPFLMAFLADFTFMKSSSSGASSRMKPSSTSWLRAVVLFAFSVDGALEGKSEAPVWSLLVLGINSTWLVRNSILGLILQSQGFPRIMSYLSIGASIPCREDWKSPMHNSTDASSLKYNIFRPSAKLTCSLSGNGDVTHPALAVQFNERKLWVAPESTRQDTGLSLTVPRRTTSVCLLEFVHESLSYTPSSPV